MWDYVEVEVKEKVKDVIEKKFKEKFSDDDVDKIKLLFK